MRHRKISVNICRVNNKLGITDKAFLKGNLVRIDINAKYLKEYNLRLPTGKEQGANELFIKGGKTSGGVTEGIINAIPKTGNGVKSKVIKE